MKTMTVKVARAFYYQGKPNKVGEVLELPHVFALEMIAAKKAEAVAKAEPKEQPEQKAGGNNARK